MATLEKIRSKSVLLLVIIGAALLAFILTDFLTSGRSIFGNPTTIAKVDGNKIDIQEFNSRYEGRGSQGQQVDDAEMQAQLLNAMIQEKLFDEEVKALGLVVTDEELTDAMLGSGAKELDAMIAQSSQGAITSAAQFRDMAFNPAKFNLDQQTASAYQAYWLELEKNVEKNLIQQKFNNLFSRSLVPNKLDLKAMEATQKAYTIKYASVPYSSLDDKKYNVSDDEIKAEYDRTRNKYRINEENRTVEYIVVDIVPSPEDIKAVIAKVDKAIKDLKGNTMPNPVIDNLFMSQSDEVPASSVTDADVKAFLDSANNGDIKRLNDYTFVQLLNRKSGVDKVNVSIIEMADAASRDSLVAELTEGKISFKDASAKGVVAQDSMELSMFNLHPALAPFEDSFKTGALNTYLAPKGGEQDGNFIFYINSRDAETPIYNVFSATINPEPSDATIDKIAADLENYAANNATVDAFKNNAAKNHYLVQEATVTPSSYRLGDTPKSRKAVSWAMSADKNEVSPVIGDRESGYYLIAIVSEINDGDYLPVTSAAVRDEITGKLRNDKKAAALISQYKGKANSVEAYAEKMKSDVKEATVYLGAPEVRGIGRFESKIAASVATAAPNKVSAPVQGNEAVIVYEVVNVENGLPSTDAEKIDRYSNIFGAKKQSQLMDKVLLGNKKVKNNILDFYDRSDR